MRRDRLMAVGMEIGGGQTTVALIDRQGQVYLRAQAKTLRGRPATATLEPYLRVIERMLLRAGADGLEVCGIGVSVPGSVDEVTRRPLLIPLLPALNNVPLCDFLEARYQLPVALHADVDAAVLGEHQFGAGRGSQRLLFLTVNAVVGAGMVIDGQLLRSRQPYVGHICHLPIAPNGPRCSCGKRGCVNTLISIDAIQRMLQRALRRGDETSLIQRILDGAYFNMQLLAEEAERGDTVAVQIYHEVCRWFGLAVSKYIELLDPHTLVLGGSILNGSDIFLTQLRSQLCLSANVSGQVKVCQMVEVVPACLGQDAALIGSIAPFYNDR